jgi:triosephosphate isomerase
MLADFEVSFGLVGHSERRSFYADDNELVGIKARKLLNVGITPIVCVGETFKQREAEETFGIISAQLEAVIERIGLENLGRIVLAYEPVWAIGTGLTASPEQAQEVHEYLRGQVALLDEAAARSLRILYGGSVKPDNAEKLFRQADVDGGLIGGASLNLIDFLTICRLAT